MSLADYVRILGRGPGRSRNLTREEARDALDQILSGTAAPEASGALLMLMRYRGESADEIAGFVEALRHKTTDLHAITPDLDWPSYAAGKSRGLPWFLLAARLLATTGHRVLLHGWNSHQNGHASVRAALPHAGIQVAATPQEAGLLLERDRIAYLPLEAICQQALGVLKLRDVLGLRSPINTALRLFNPACAQTSVQGVFHPPYRDLQRDAALLLGQARQMVLKGAGGEFERNPAKTIDLMGVLHTQAYDLPAAPLLSEAAGRLAEGPARSDSAALADLWQGKWQDAYAEAIVTGTAAAALLAMAAAPDLATAEAEAAHLWAGRDTAFAA